MRSINKARVVVVGGAGFLGSHLVNHLIDDRQCEVLVVDNLCAGRREFVHSKAKFEHHDVTLSETYLRSIFAKYDAQFVFNYSAWPYIPDSFERPGAVCDVNFMGAIKVINAAQDWGVNAILQVSSAEIYGDAGDDTLATDKHGRHGIKIAEEDEVRPHSSYGVAKAAVDFYVQSAWKERQTPCIALRQFNCVGERETHPYVVPEIISQLNNWCLDKNLLERFQRTGTASMDGTPVVKLGNNSYRDFLYAGDQARIAVELLERGSLGEVYNLGSENGIKIYDLAKLIGKLMGFADVKVEQDPARVRPWEIWHLQSDNSKINEMRWQGSDTYKMTPLEEALKKTIAYYQSNDCKWCWEK